ncbi:MAG: ABC transporter permease subunit [Pontibacterium sp.]
MSIETSNIAPDLDFDTPAAKRHRKLRRFKDSSASVAIATGGISVIVAILLIFFYLLYEVAPMFFSAEIKPWNEEKTTYATPGKGNTLYLAMEEQAEIGLRVDDQGTFTFFDTRTGDVISEEANQVPAGATVTSFALASDASRTFALGYSNGEVSVFKHSYKATYPDGKRVITPYIEYPLGEAPVEVSNQAVNHFVINGEGEEWSIITQNENAVVETQISLTESFITGEIEAEVDQRNLNRPSFDAAKKLLTPDRRWLLMADNDARIAAVDLRSSKPMEKMQVIETNNGNITGFDLLLGGSSIMVSTEKGAVSQWFFVRDDQNQWKLTKIREFDTGNAPVTSVAMEHRRKGFVTLDTEGELRIFNSTARRTVLSEKIAEASGHVVLAPRSNALLLEEGDKLSFWLIDNEHPEVSWSALWEEVWYEGYVEPDYIWQSSASNNDFEPKYSLMPLAFGTLKAAFYAMLLAMPLAICGAIYTAYFMVPAMRRKVKPFIELMEALPTVILGFLAGLWLAPFMETNLAGIFLTVLMIPVAIIAFAFVWANLPSKVRYLIPEGWDVVLLVPVVILATLLALSLADGMEAAIFGGDMRYWISNELGIPYDQRNALVVGVAMGFAVIPTIFSITEDAIFAVPKHLSYGSLALGATPWQTLTRVVMPTASPGIFSAVMIGMGRAVGETMIVLMATGNTPIMDLNIFEGMRTLAANIAVEMPESEVGSTHYRILFLAAFVLFLFTFVVNTLAETVRQHLRKKYGSL